MADCSMRALPTPYGVLQTPSYLDTIGGLAFPLATLPATVCGNSRFPLTGSALDRQCVLNTLPFGGRISFTMQDTREVSESRCFLHGA